MNNPYKYKPQDFGNFTDEPVRRKVTDTADNETRSGKRKDKKHLQRIKPAGGFVVPWQMYEADPYENQAE